MKQNKTSVCFFAVISACFLFGCNESATTSEKKEEDTTAVAQNKDTSSMPAYNPAMDAYNTGGDAIEKLGDTLGVKMYVATMKPGDSAALHTHPDHTVYVLQGGKLAVTFQGRGRQIIELKTGTGIIGGPLSDAGKNVGNTTIKLLVTDIYRPRGN